MWDLSKMQFKLFKHNFTIHTISFYRYKLISHWLDFYVKYAVKPQEDQEGIRNYLNKPKLKVDADKKYTFTCDEFLSFLFMLFIAVRGFCASFLTSYSTHPTLPIYFGSFFQMMDVRQPFFVEFLFTLWSTNYLANILVAGRFKVKDYCWLEVIRFLEGHVSAQKLGLLEKEAVLLKKRARFIMKLVHLSAVSVTSNSMFLFAMFCFIKYYPQFDFLFFNLIWFFLYTNYTIQLTYMIYMNAAYLFIVCTIMRIKFRRLEEYLSAFDNSPQQWHFGSQIIRSQLHRKPLRSATVDMVVSCTYMNRLIRENLQYNKFWAYLFSISLAWRLWIINFILFIVLFYPLGAHFLSIYRLITVVEVLSFFSLVYQASLIPVDAKKIGKQLRQFLNFHPVKSLSVKIKIANQFEFLECSPSMGLSLVNGVTVEPLTIIYIIREFSTWFFLLAAISIQLT